MATFCVNTFQPMTEVERRPTSTYHKTAKAYIRYEPLSLIHQVQLQRASQNDIASLNVRNAGA